MSEEFQELKEKLTSPVAKEESKVWTDDYVKQLREESKENRLKFKATEKLLKIAFGLGDDEDVTEEKINSIKSQTESKIKEAISKSNDLILKNSIKSLDGEYDIKLVNKLLDKSTLEIDENGDVIGLTEAVTKLAEEFPAIKKIQTITISSNPASNQTSEIQVLQEQLNLAKQQGNTTMMVALKNKIFGLTK